MLLRNGADAGHPRGRSFAGLIVLGVGIGIAAALGFLPAPILVALGGPAAAMVARRRLGGVGSGGDLVWFTAIAWAAVTPTLRYGTLDLSVAAAAQSALGPAVLVGPLPTATVVATSVVLGLVAAGGWLGSLPKLAGSPERAALDQAARWGEAAMVASVVVGGALGPSAGTLLHARVTLLVGGLAAASFVATALAAAVLSLLHRHLARLPDWLGFVVAPACLVALVSIWTIA